MPDVGQLYELVDDLRRAGADASLVVEGDLAAVPATVGATAYRIAQEALTNAAKHSPGASVSVRLDAGGHQLELWVESAGPPRQGWPRIGGHEGTRRGYGRELHCGPGRPGLGSACQRPAPDGVEDGLALIRLLLVDDQELVRAGLRGILREQFGFEVAGECSDGTEVLEAVRLLDPDVVLMDVRMPRLNGVEAGVGPINPRRR